MKEQLKLQREIGELVKKAIKLDGEVRALVVDHQKKMKEIDEEYRHRVKERRKEISNTMNEIRRLKWLAEDGTDDEELALGKAVLRKHNNLSVSSQLLFLIQEIRDELGIGASSSAILATKIDDCIYSVPPGCTHCTGGGGT